MVHGTIALRRRRASITSSITVRKANRRLGRYRSRKRRRTLMITSAVSRRRVPRAERTATIPGSALRRGVVSREGFEPSTKGLKVPCSAAELPAHRQGTRPPVHQARSYASCSQPITSASNSARSARRILWVHIPVVASSRPTGATSFRFRPRPGRGTLAGRPSGHCRWHPRGHHLPAPPGRADRSVRPGWRCRGSSHAGS